MCGDCKTLTLATDPNDGSKFEAWLPHNDEDERAGHVWIGITNDDETGEPSFSEAGILLSIAEQDQLILWIQERRRERAGEDYR